jgi:threonine dehydrogenase-like Zn-dependent dehydrogenase
MAKSPIKIRILGAGPAGLYAGYRLKRLLPSSDIMIVEQNPQDVTSLARCRVTREYGPAAPASAEGRAYAGHQVSGAAGMSHPAIPALKAMLIGQLSSNPPSGGVLSLRHILGCTKPTHQDAESERRLLR